jgi:hypothetical protein
MSISVGDNQSAWEWDAFISHASEDKESFVEPLVVELKKYGIRVWYDKFTLRVGSSLRESIDQGLATSQFGIVVLSEAFFAKNWPQKELNALFSRQVQEGQVILPVRHGISQAEMVKKSSLVSDIKAASSDAGPAQVARDLVQVIRPEALRLQQGFSELTNVASRISDAVSEQNRGLRADIIVSSSISCDMAMPNEPVVPGMVGALIQNGLQVNLIASDPAKYNMAPLTGNLRLTKDALLMIDEATKTGETIRLGPEHVASASMEILTKLFPDTDFKTLVIAPALEITRRIHRFGVIFRSGNEAIRYSVLHFQAIKPGTEQLTIVSRDKLPIVMTFTLGLASGRSTHFRFELVPGDFSPEEYEKAQTAVALLQHPRATITLTMPDSEHVVAALSVNGEELRIE